ncbi:MAG TPA: FtsX-like permease family protein [Gemmatimonadaceae bacterium]|jgi:predicted permease
MIRAQIHRAWTTLCQDVDFTFRALRRAPGLTAAVLGSLVIGIAAAATVSTIAYKVILQPTAVRNPSDVVVIWPRSSIQNPSDFPIWGEEYKSYVRSTTLSSTVGGYEFHGAVLRYLELSDTVVGARVASVTGSFFSLLGTSPVLGRLLVPSDDHTGADPTLVISTGLWQRAFGRDPNIIGRRVNVFRRTATIVGVVPATLDFPRGTEAWFPLTLTGGHADSILSFVNIIARKKPVVTNAQMGAEFLAFLHNPGAVHFQPDRAYLPTFSAAVTPVDDIINGSSRSVVLLLVGAGALLLLSTAVNVAILLLVRALSRRTEFAVRSAIGASRMRVGSQVFVEGVVLALIGGIIATFVAWVGSTWLLSAVSIDLPHLDGTDLRPTLIATAAIATIVVGVLVSLVPTAVAARIAPDAMLRVRAGARGRGAERLRSSLVGTQVALSLCALASAALVVQSFINLSRLNLGFDADKLLLVRLSSHAQTAVPANIAAESERYRVLLDQLSTRLVSIPGVASVAPMYLAPFNEGGNDATFVHPGESDAQRGTEPMVNLAMGTETFLRTLGIRLVAGRNFTAADNTPTSFVTLVDETYARQMWAGENPVGKQLGTRAAGPFYTVIGVFSATHLRTLRASSGLVLIAPREFGNSLPSYLAVRAVGDPGKMVHTVRTTINDAHLGELFGVDIEPISQLASREIETPALSAALVAAFAACIVVLCAVGLYGSLAAFVRSRHYDIAVRLAIGADPADAFREVLIHGIRIAAIGAIAGVVAVIASGRLLRAVVFGVQANDPTMLIGSLIAVLGIACAACYLPARRSARINPADALKAG